MRNSTFYLLAGLAVHVVLLLLASTRMSVVTGPPYTWEYFRYYQESGWGYRYVSYYELSTVILYLLGNLAGLAAYVTVARAGSPILGVIGSALSISGLLSFAFEASHWWVDHNRSFIFSAPIASFALAGVAAWLLVRADLRREPPGGKT